MRDRDHGRGGWLLLVPLILLAAVFLLPVALVLLNSFKSRLYISSAPFALPDAVTFVGFENYLTGLNTAGFAAAFGRSLFITVGSVLLLVVGCSMTAWFIVRSGSRFCKLLYYLFVFSMIVPFQMVMYTMTFVVGRLNLDSVVGILPVCWQALCGPSRRRLRRPPPWTAATRSRAFSASCCR